MNHYFAFVGRILETFLRIGGDIGPMIARLGLAHGCATFARWAHVCSPISAQAPYRGRAITEGDIRGWSRGDPKDPSCGPERGIARIKPLGPAKGQRLAYFSALKGLFWMGSPMFWAKMSLAFAVVLARILMNFVEIIFQLTGELLR